MTEFERGREAMKQQILERLDDVLDSYAARKATECDGIRVCIEVIEAMPARRMRERQDG